jgi:acetyl esterase/lipase
VLEQEPVAAGVETTFQPWAQGMHLWPVFISAGIPESALAIEELASFFRLHARSDTVEEAAS